MDYGDVKYWFWKLAESEAAGQVEEGFAREDLVILYNFGSIVYCLILNIHELWIV